MNKTIVYAAHQPNYLPYLGLFYKICQSDTFVFLDDVQFTKSSGPAHERNVISHKGVCRYIKVPIVKRFGDPINNVRINYEVDWPARDISSMEVCYKSAAHFEEVAEFLFPRLETRYSNLAEMNATLIKDICLRSGIERVFLSSSDFDVASTGTKRLIEIGKLLGACEYYSGTGAKAYLDERAFGEASIKLTYSDYRPDNNGGQSPVSPMHLSVVDFLFRYGFDFSTLGWARQ